MFIQRIIPGSILAGLVLSVAGTAFAHQPPALTSTQRAAALAVACEGATPRPGAGYRDSFARFGDPSQPLHERFAMSRSGDGYRQSVVRFGPTTRALVACGVPVNAPRTTASR